MIYDPRWLKPVADMYAMYHAWEPYLRNETPLARVGLVYSQGSNVDDHTQGMYHALVEARIPFEMVHDGLLDEAHTRQFATLILPNIAALSDAQCQQLREFVQRGGPGRHLCNVALRRGRRPASGLRPGRPVRSVLRRAPPKGPCATPTWPSELTR